MIVLAVVAILLAIWALMALAVRVDLRHAQRDGIWLGAAVGSSVILVISTFGAAMR